MALKPNARSHIGKVHGTLMFFIAGKATPEQTNEAWLRNIGELPPIEETYAMRLGSYLEQFLVDEYERASGSTITRRQEEVPLAELPHDVFATIDGVDEALGAVTEFKFASPHFTRNEIFHRHYDQVALQMMCTGLPRGLLVVAQGTAEPIEIECLRDAAYEAELRTRIHAWLICIRTLTPPCPEPMPLPPPEKWRTINLEYDQPNWRDEMLDHLSTYASTAQAVATYDAAGKAARALVPDDVGVVLAGEFRIARNKRGTLAITRRSA
jgi:hypothetical protein